ncbi:TonB family protein [Hyphococcus flavus]|uniref:TonB family protein n=1 Tax=Hyphococcus flavus TaxID=1866326 RepID=A0AAF0CBU0_9PROT|nr:TonB family protein [Hyphococcus flavus]WDI31825.1 TonB family protein [Hyphococcus flavus]
MRLLISLLAFAVFAGTIFASESRAEVVVYDPPIASGVERAGQCPKRYRYVDENYSGVPKLVYRCAPRYPERCMRRAQQVEAVELLFDVDSDGKPHNVRITRTTNECLNKAAATAVLKWRYEKTVDGATGLLETITMQLAS